MECATNKLHPHLTLYLFSIASDALLADLQNSVPGQQTQPQYGIVQSKQQQQQQHFVDNTPGYGSLRGKAQQSQPQVVSGNCFELMSVN